MDMLCKADIGLFFKVKKEVEIRILSGAQTRLRRSGHLRGGIIAGTKMARPSSVWFKPRKYHSSVHQITFFRRLSGSQFLNENFDLTTNPIIKGFFPPEMDNNV